MAQQVPNPQQPNLDPNNNQNPQQQNINYDNLSPQQLQPLVANGSIRAVRKPRKFKSSVWDTFYILKYGDGNVINSYVQCQRCNGFFSGNTGTGTLAQHLVGSGCKGRIAGNNQGTLDSMIRNTRNVSNADKKYY